MQFAHASEELAECRQGRCSRSALLPLGVMVTKLQAMLGRPAGMKLTGKAALRMCDFVKP